MRREQVHVLLASLPVLLAVYFLAGGIGSFAERPVAGAIVLLPLLAVVVALGLPLVRERRLVLGGGFLPFFVAYCVLFSVAASTRLLEGRRAVIAGFEEEAPSNVLALSRLGDWHYLVAPPAPPAHDLVIVTLPPFAGMTAVEARRIQAALIAQAIDRGAKGIAFDYHLETSSDADRVLCFWIRRAESAALTVIYGERVDERDQRIPLAPELARCLSAERVGTLTGLMEADGRVRMVPTSHLGDTTLRSFSYRIASALVASGLDLPRVGLAQFVAPRVAPEIVASGLDDLDAGPVRDRFVIVGADRPGDVRATPYDSMPGVLIHALAAHGLRSGHLIQRLDARWLLPVIFALCYVLTLIQASGGGARRLMVGGALLSAGVVLSAIVAMRVGLLWIDASYPLLAVWILTGMLAGGARLQAGRMQADTTAVTEDAEGPLAGSPTDGRYDVFLSHNSKDKPAALELATALRDRGLRVWIDVWELVPGRPWQESIEQAIASVGSAAVLVGRDGIGPWEEPEMRACLDECVRRRMPVIPVLLPGAPSQPQLPLFLAQFTWVDLRDGLHDPGLDRVEWGITGVKPRREKG